MPKIKETKVALKGQDPKKAPKASETLRKAPPHTVEVQNESDSEGSNSDSSSGRSSGSESDASKRKNTKKPKPSKVKETEPDSPPVPEDSSSDDSDSDSDLEAEVQKAKAKKAPAAVEPNGAVHKTKGSSEDSGSESESESESDSEDESDEQETAVAPKAAGQADASETTAAAVVPAQPFAPPPGFKPLSTKNANASTLKSLFEPSSLPSKQIWHITAPSSVSLAGLKSVSLSAIQSHQTVLSHNGTDYNLAEEPTNNARVLIPSSKSDAYAAVEVPVSKTLNLQQTIRLPNISSRQTNPATASSAAASVSTPQIRAPRPQPKGLRMRCKPPGFGDEDPGLIGSSDDESDSDVSMAEAPSAGFKLPTSSKESRSKRKRDEKEAAESSPPKDKKRRKALEAEKKLVEGTRAEAPETAEEKARKKQEKKDKKRKDKSK